MKYNSLELANIKTHKDLKQYIESCLNDFETGESSKEDTIQILYDLVGYISEQYLKEVKKWLNY